MSNTFTIPEYKSIFLTHEEIAQGVTSTLNLATIHLDCSKSELLKISDFITVEDIANIYKNNFYATDEELEKIIANRLANLQVSSDNAINIFKLNGEKYTMVQRNVKLKSRKIDDFYKIIILVNINFYNLHDSYREFDIDELNLGIKSATRIMTGSELITLTTVM